MTIYSGFTNRKQESDYDKCLDALIVVLFKRIIKIYNGESCDENQFQSFLFRILSCMFELELKKQSFPKYSKRSDILCSILKMDYKSAFNKYKNDKNMINEQSFNQNSYQIRHSQPQTQNNQAITNSMKIPLSSSLNSKEINFILVEKNKNINSIQQCYQESENTPSHQQFYNGKQNVNTIQENEKQIYPKDDSCENGYKGRITQFKRPKSSSSHMDNIKQNLKVSQNPQQQINQQSDIQYKETSDNLDKYKEIYLNCKVKNNSESQNSPNKTCEEVLKLQIGQNPTLTEESDDYSEQDDIDQIYDEEQLLKNIEDMQMQYMKSQNLPRHEYINEIEQNQETKQNIQQTNNQLQKQNRHSSYSNETSDSKTEQSQQIPVDLRQSDELKNLQSNKNKEIITSKKINDQIINDSRKSRFQFEFDNQITNKDVEVKNEKVFSLKAQYQNIKFPGKKGNNQITEEQIKINSPQLCQTQIDTIKQQLNMQTSYLQVQQKILDEKLNKQSIELLQLQQKNIIKKELVQNEDNKISKTYCNEQNIQDSKQPLNENISNYQLIQEVQEEDEQDDSIYNNNQKKKNKIEKIQLRQLNNEKQIKNKKVDLIKEKQFDEEINYKFTDLEVKQINPKKEDETGIQSQSENQQSYKMNEENQNNDIQQINTQIDNQKLSQKNIDITLLQTNNQKRIQYVSQSNGQSKTLNDISNIYANCSQLNQFNSQFERSKTGISQNFIESNEEISKFKINKNQDNKQYKRELDQENIQYKIKDQNSISQIKQYSQLNQNRKFNDKKLSLEPQTVKNIQQNKKITSETPSSILRNYYPISNSSKRSKTQDYTNSSLLQNSNFQTSSSQVMSDCSQSFKGQFRISKKRDFSENIRDSLSDLVVQDFSANKSTHFQKMKSENITPFPKEEYSQLNMQFSTDKSIQNQNNFSSQSTKSKTQNLTEINQNMIISNIVNCPLKRQYLNKLQKQFKKKCETPTSKYMKRPQSCNSSSNQQYWTKQKNENGNKSFLIQSQPKITQSNSPISYITPEQSKLLYKIASKDSSFKF